jgi:hypothetical protein
MTPAPRRAPSDLGFTRDRHDKVTKGKTNFRTAALLVASSTLIALLAGEAAFRMMSGQALLELVNYRIRAIKQANLGASIHDPDLGWALRPGLAIRS